LTKFHLSRQEGVSYGIYKKILVDVIKNRSESEENQSIVAVPCITYVKCKENEERGLPSSAYKNVIINGAKDVRLPEDYIQYLRSLPDNGHISPIGINLPKEVYESS
jgi:hypothetical protein